MHTEGSNLSRLTNNCAPDGLGGADCLDFYGESAVCKDQGGGPSGLSRANQTKAMKLSEATLSLVANGGKPPKKKPKVPLLDATQGLTAGVP